jgi:hypothetical protein
MDAIDVDNTGEVEIFERSASAAVFTGHRSTPQPLARTTS